MFHVRFIVFLNDQGNQGQQQWQQGQPAPPYAGQQQPGWAPQQGAYIPGQAPQQPYGGGAVVIQQQVFNFKNCMIKFVLGLINVI